MQCHASLPVLISIHYFSFLLSKFTLYFESLLFQTRLIWSIANPACLALLLYCLASIFYYVWLRSLYYRYVISSSDLFSHTRTAFIYFNEKGPHTDAGSISCTNPHFALLTSNTYKMYIRLASYIGYTYLHTNTCNTMTCLHVYKAKSAIQIIACMGKKEKILISYMSILNQWEITTQSMVHIHKQYIWRAPKY